MDIVSKQTDAISRPTESEVMALFEQIAALVEEAQSLIQNDGLISNIDEAKRILEINMKIRAVTLEIDTTIGSVRKY